MVSHPPARPCRAKEQLKVHPWSYNDLGLELTRSGDGIAEATLTITDKHKNGYNFCHGGVLTAACDTVIAWAGETLCQGNDVAINSSMYTRLFRPTKIGDKLNFRAKVINPADKAPEFLVVITNQDDKVVGFARGDVAMKDPGATKQPA